MGSLIFALQFINLILKLKTFLEFPSGIDPETLHFSGCEDASRAAKRDAEGSVPTRNEANILVSGFHRVPECQVESINNERQLHFGLHMVKEQFQVDPAQYSHAIFSCAIQGTACAILEKRSIMWIAEPYTLRPEAMSLLEEPLPNPLPPWEINVSEYMPNRLIRPYDIIMEVPGSTLYRACFKCKGKGALQMEREMALCSTCLGLSTLRLTLRLRVYWCPKVVVHSDLNGYEIPSTLLSLVDDADPSKYHALTRYYKESLINMLTKFVPPGVRFKQCTFDLRAIPLIEIVYLKKSRKKSRFLVCGEQRKAVFSLNRKG